MFSVIKIYVWKGVTYKGKSCKGKSLTRNKFFLQESLRQQGIFVKNIQLKFRLITTKNIKTKDLLFFTRQIASLLQAGLPLVQILELLEKTKNLPLKEFVKQIRINIENGYSLAEALSNHTPAYFSKFHWHLIALGERTSSLERMLGRIAEHIEKTSKVKAKITSAIIYPSIVIIMAIFVFLALLLGVVPQFEQLFVEVGSQLPLLTRAVICLSKFLGSACIYIGMFFFIFIGVFVLLRNKYSFISIKQDQFLLKIPIVKKIFAEVITARLSRTLATALFSGLPLLDALQAIAEFTRNYVYKNAILSSCDLMRNGYGFYQALLEQKVWPADFLQFVKLGETSGSLGEMLNNVASLYEEKLDYFVSNLSILLEPLLIIILGTIIGGLIIAMYLPIFKLGSVI